MHREGDRQGGGVHQPVGDAGGLEQALQQVRDGWLADGAEPQRADRDPELGARHHQRDVFHRAQRDARGVGAGGGAGLHHRPAGRDQRELGADEERVREQQRDRDQEREGLAHRCSPPGPARGGGTSARSSRTRSTRRPSSRSTTSRTSPHPHGVADRGQPREPGDDEPGNRLVRRLLRKSNARDLLDLVGAEQAGQ